MSSDQPSDHQDGSVGPSLTQELNRDTTMLAGAIGGWRGMLDSALPTVAFLMLYTLSGHQLRLSVVAAVATALVLVVIRVVKRQTLQQIGSGIFGLAVSVWLSMRTGQASNFFLPGILWNAGYALVCLVSIFIRKPVLGFLIGALKGNDTSWLKHPSELRLYSSITWLWTLIFSVRVGIMLPMYFAGQVTALGVLKLILGWPLYLLGIYITVVMLRTKR